MEKIWLKHYPAGVPAEVDVAGYPSLVALLQESFTRYRERSAYRYMGQSIRYGQVDALSQAFAAWLQGQGLERGDRVAVMLPNVPQYPVAVAAHANSNTSSRTPAPKCWSSWRTSPTRCSRCGRACR
jgi:long-chain acyl-CoA synthetase